MSVNAPQSITNPPPEQDIFIVRGDEFVWPLGFVNEPEIVANPSLYRLRLVLRRRQTDALPDLISQEAVLEIEPDDTINGVQIDVMGTFTLTPLETQSIPAQGCVYFVEWTNSIGGQPSRIVQGRVQVGD